MLVYEERGKPEYPEKNLSEQGREPTTNRLNHIWRQVRKSTPGHISGKRVLSPLHHPCSPFSCFFVLFCFFANFSSGNSGWFEPWYVICEDGWAADIGDFKKIQLQRAAHYSRLLGYLVCSCYLQNSVRIIKKKTDFHLNRVNEYLKYVSWLTFGQFSWLTMFQFGAYFARSL